jgi:hypothetical protein
LPISSDCVISATDIRLAAINAPEPIPLTTARKEKITISLDSAMKTADIPRMSKPEILILNRPILSIKYPIGIRQIALVNHKTADSMPITNAKVGYHSNCDKSRER